MRTKAPGFTLIEALIALVVVAVLVALAVPAVAGAMAAGHSAASQATLSETLLEALNHSTITGSEVVVCSREGDDCSGQVDWSSGWLAFADLNGNRSRESNETILRRQSGLEYGVRLRSTRGRTRIVFQPTGGATAGSNVTFTFCDRRGAEKATSIILANSGRMRRAPASAKAAGACLDGG
jgi:type IV fimbrial biogenesis protein FimT